MGLIAILETLLLPSQKGFMSFDDAWIIKRSTGLPVLIFTNPKDNVRYILLNSSELDIATFLQHAENDEATSDDNESQQCLELSEETVHNILKSMDSEYDRLCARALLSADRSRSEFYNLGLKPDAAIKAVKRVNNDFQEHQNAQVSATDLLKLRLRERKDKLLSQLQNIRKLEVAKKESWPQKRLEELEENGSS